MRIFIMLGALGLLAGCKETPAGSAADQLDNAAAQSDPAAAETLRNAADHIREDEPANIAIETQDALEAAGNAQLPAASPNRQALPHRAGDPMPPAKTETQ